MVLHSRGCGRVARRRFERIGPPGRALGSREALFCFRGFPAGTAPGTPFFIFLLSFLPSDRIPCGFPEGPFLFIPLFFFPLVSPHVDSRLRGWCHSGTDVTFGGVFWVPARVFWVPAGVFLGAVWVFVGGYVVGDFVDLHLTDDEMARFHDSARIVREHFAMIADRL